MTPSPPPPAADPDTLRARRAAEQDRETAETGRRARDSYRRGQREAEAGRHAEAIRHLERAHRLARGDHTIRFGLALARLRAGDPGGAAPHLLALAAALDLRPVLLALAIARRQQGLLPQAARHLADSLSRQSLDTADPSVLPIADALAAESGAAGWCAVEPDGVLLVRAVGGRRILCRPRLDGVPLTPEPAAAAPGAPLRLALGPFWRRARTVAVEPEGDVALLAPTLSILSIARTEGVVAADEAGRLVGWAWCPNSPEHVPRLAVADTGGNVLLAVPCDAPVPPELVTLRFGMHPRGFRATLPENVPARLRVLDETGAELPGSPIEPFLERDAARPGADADAMRRFLPVRADADPRPRPPTPPGGRRRPPRRPPVAVAIPVHGGRRQTLDCLDAVFRTAPAPAAIHVLDDGSPDPVLAGRLDALAAAGRIRLHRHEGGRNLGFPASVNRLLAETAPCDVVLLNSDARPDGPGWLARLAAAARSAPDIASATPFASEGSIVAYPVPGRSNPFPGPADGALLARLAAAANDGVRVEIPVGVGFALLLRRDALDAVGPFRDDLFGRGYGEENDWCLRARRQGWRHVAAADTYVAHEGGASFRAGRLALMGRNEAILNRLHPGYDRLVARHAARDPLAESRRRLDEARLIEQLDEARLIERPDEARLAGRLDEAPLAEGLAPPSDAAPILLVTHAAGGGVERFVRARVAHWRRLGRPCLVLRPDPDGFRDDLACLADAAAPSDHPNLRYVLPSETGRLRRLLDALRPARIELHHLLNHADEVATLCRTLGPPLEIFLHDYAFFCHRIGLFGPEKRYCGEPDREGCRICIAELGSLLDEAGDVDALLARSAALFEAADRIVAPGEDVARRFRRHFPALGPLAVEPWEPDPARRPRRTPRRPPGAPARIVVPGGIGPEKGVDLLLACVRDGRRRRLPLRFTVVGYTSLDDELLALGVELTGPYERDEAVPLLEAARADLAFLPSLWPETWSYVLTECLEAGLPVALFDFGTPAERLRRAGQGILLPVGLAPDAVNDRLLAATLDVAAAE